MALRVTKADLEKENKELKAKLYALVLNPDTLLASMARNEVILQDRLEKSVWMGSCDYKPKFTGFLIMKKK